MKPTRSFSSRPLGAVLAAIALAACAAPSRASPEATTAAGAHPSRPCPDAVVVLAGQVFLVGAERADEIAIDDAPAEMRAASSSCAPDAVLQAYVEEHPDARSLAARIASASAPVHLRQALVRRARTYESSTALGSFSRLAPAPIDFDLETVAVMQVVVAERVVCNDRHMGPRDRSAASSPPPPPVDTSPRWIDTREVQVESIGPLRVAGLRQPRIDRCPAQQGCGCDRQTAYAFFSVPRSALPILVRVR